MGLAALIAKAMNALIMPAKIATARPLVKLNSFMTDFFCSDESSRSFADPALPHIAIPTRHTP